MKVIEIEINIYKINIIRVYRTMQTRRMFTSAHTVYGYARTFRVTLASKSVEYSFRRREGEIIIAIVIIIEILRAPLLRANSWSVAVYTQPAHMRSHSLWFSFLAFCFSFVRLSFSSPVQFSVCFALTGCRSVCRRDSILIFSLLLLCHCRCIRYEWRIKRSRNR